MIDKTIVILRRNFVILTINGACEVIAETSRSPHKTVVQNSFLSLLLIVFVLQSANAHPSLLAPIFPLYVPSYFISHTCLFTSFPSIFCPSHPTRKHHCPRSSSRPTLSLNISLPTASLVFQRLIIASWVLAGPKASSINSAADTGLEIKDKTLQNDEKKKTKTKLYDIALNECV